MKPPGDQTTEADGTEPGLLTSSATESEATGLPGFRTWRGVYWFVLVVLVVWVGLLAALTRMYS